MTNNIQEQVNQITRKGSVYFLDLSNRDLVGEANLSEFTSLNGFNAANNQLENLDFLNTLPNKEKLTSLNFFGNQIKEIDLAWLLSIFPNLKRINFSKNPAKAKNLNNLTSEQFGKIVAGLQNKQIQLNCWKGTVLMDLLIHAKELVARGNSAYNAHLVKLEKMVPVENLPKMEVKKEAVNNQSNSKINGYLFASGLVLIGIVILSIGYWLGKNKSKNSFFEENI